MYVDKIKKIICKVIRHGQSRNSKLMRLTTKGIIIEIYHTAWVDMINNMSKNNVSNLLILLILAI